MSPVRAALRVHRGVIRFVVAYAVLYGALSFTSERAGVFLASGTPSLVPIALALAVLVMRITLLFVLLPSLAYRLVRGTVGVRGRPSGAASSYAGSS